MRQVAKEYITLAAQNLAIIGPIWEFGACQVSSQVGFADLRPVFRIAGYRGQYIGADIIQGPGVDVIMSASDIRLDSNSVGTIIFAEALEHCSEPHKVVSEFHRVLVPGGILILTTIMGFSIHNPPDYFRYTPQGLLFLAKPFDQVLVNMAGEPKLPHSVNCIAWKTKPENDIYQKMVEIMKQWEINCFKNR
jgi:SAM-dependent methyltransferase